MDGETALLKHKLDHLLREAAEVAVALDQTEGTIGGVPHYALIEARAHELGQQLSRQIQARQMGQVTTPAAAAAKYPACGTRCETHPRTRSVRSIDGPLTIEEPVAHCPACRRDFFPPAGDLGL